MNRITFDPSDEGQPKEIMAQEQAALQQGEKLVAAQEEDRRRVFERAEAESEDVSLIGGKFKTQDDLLKAYNELQTKLSTKASDADDDEDEPDTEGDEVEPQKGEYEGDDENLKTLMDISQRFEADEGLTKEDMATLSNMDSKTLIETFFKYQQAQKAAAQNQAANDAEMQDIRNAVGGDDAYGEMIKWAGSNLSQAEIEQYNKVIETNNPASIRFAVEALNNRWKGSEGFEAPLVTGRKAPSKTKTFRSHAELSRAIADPRYKTDPAYRLDVEERLSRSSDLL